VPQAAARVDPEQVCTDMFAAKSGGLDASRLFEERYRGVTVRWTGTLVKAERVSFDLVFGFEPFCKAKIKVHEIASALTARQAVLAVVQLPAACTVDLSHRIGEEVTFEGELVGCDHVQYTLLVRNGQLVE
jgi:hypothetical protein